MTHADLIDRWPSLADFAADLRLAYGTAKAMRRRKSVPPDLWSHVVSAAKARGIEGVTLECLADAVARPFAEEARQ